MLEDGKLKERKKQVYNLLLLIKLLDDLLAEVVFSTLMILFFLLLLRLLLLLNIDSHVALVFVFLNLIEYYASLDLLIRLAPLLLERDHVVTDQVHQMETLINNQIFLVEKHLDVVGVFVTICIHHVVESHNEILDTLDCEVGFN